MKLIRLIGHLFLVIAIVTYASHGMAANSQSELVDDIRQQFEQCWVAPKNTADDITLKVALIIKLSKKGKVTDIKLASRHIERYKKDSKFRLVANAALNAVKKCNHVKGLPLDKYDVWKDLELTFDAYTPK